VHWLSSILGTFAKVLVYVFHEGVETTHKLVHLESYLHQEILRELEGEVGGVGLRHKSFFVGEASSSCVAACPYALAVVFPVFYVLPAS